MNTLESFDTMSPNGSDDICAKFTIDEVLSPFVLHNITTSINESYALSLWIKSDAEGSVHIRGNEITTTTDWVYHEFTYKATGIDLKFFFNTVGTYYIYHPKLERGLKVTEWTEAPEDSNAKLAESVISQMSDIISMLVTDGNGGSLMTQTADGGWTFSMANTNDAVNTLSERLSELQTTTGDVNATVTILQQTVTDIGETMEYVRIGTWEGEPCIQLGESDSDKSLMITNTRILFRVGSSTPTEVTTYGLVTDNIEVKGEVKQGGFVQITTGDGGWGLLWRGVTS